METNHSASAFGSHVLHRSENFKKTLNIVNSYAGKDTSSKLYDVQSYINRNPKQVEEDKDCEYLAVFAEKLKDFEPEANNHLLKDMEKELNDEVINPNFFSSDEYITSMNIDIDDDEFQCDIEVDDGIVRTFSEER